MSDNDMEALRAALQAANTAVVTVEREQGDAIRAATAEVRARFADHLGAARQDRAMAQTAFNAAAEAAGAGDPRVGREVVRPAEASSWRGPGRPEARGRVMVWKRGDSASTRYTPSPGDLYIRHLKKDGTPGQRIERMNGNELPWRWEFSKGASGAS